MTSIVAPDMTYEWIELAALLDSGKMVRDHYIRAEDVDGLSGWRERFGNTDVFSSVALHSRPDNSSAAVLPMFFDIDGPDDLPAARESTISLCELLMAKILVPQDSIDIFFSGAKGFHLMVAPSVFRASFSADGLALYKKMATRAGEAGVRFVDISVYTHKRLWRLSNSRHRKTGLFKIPLTYEELRDISIDGIKELAANPRPEGTLAQHQISEKTAQWYRRALAALAKLEPHSEHRVTTGRTFKQGWRMPPCIKTIQTATLPDGARHQTYLSLARFYRYIKMHPEEIRERLETLDRRNPIRDPDYIDRAIKWGCDHPGFPGCDDESLRRYCRPENCFYAKLKNHGKER